MKNLGSVSGVVTPLAFISVSHRVNGLVPEDCLQNSFVTWILIGTLQLFLNSHNVFVPRKLILQESTLVWSLMSTTVVSGTPPLLYWITVLSVAWSSCVFALSRNRE